MNDRNYKSVKIVLWIILFANFIVSAIKLSVGFASNSHGVIADGIHSFSDGDSNIVGLIGIRLASKPVDKKHQYGHSKFEILASLFIGIMLLYMAIQIITRAIESFKNPTVLSVSNIQCVLMLMTIFVNIIVATSEYHFGKKLKSTILVTDSLHTRGDILISSAVLVGLIIVKAGLPMWIDTTMSLVVAVAVLISALEIIKDCVDVLVDSTVVDINEVTKIVMSVPGVLNVHHVRSRGAMSQVFIDLHVIINPDSDVTYGHNMSHKLESVLKEHFGENTEVAIHVEPDDGKHTIRVISP